MKKGQSKVIANLTPAPLNQLNYGSVYISPDNVRLYKSSVMSWIGIVIS
jgi:hypothetical protein